MELFLLSHIPPPLGKARKRMTPYQTQRLMERYRANSNYLEQEEKVQLAQSLNISTKRIGDWFDQRCLKQKRRGMLCEGDLTSVTSNTCAL